MKLSIDPSERLILIGKTGSGKTQWAKYMLRMVAQHMPVVIVDPKEFWLGKFPEWETNKKAPGTIDKPHLVDSFNPKFHVQCLQIDEDQEDTRLEHMCYAVLDYGRNTGPIFIYFDETEDIATALSIPRYIRRIWKTGRELGVGAWVSTQAPKGIPKIFKSQAEKFVAFKVGDEDVDVVASIVHATPEEVRNIHKYHWLFYDTASQDHAVLNPPIPYKKV